MFAVLEKNKKTFLLVQKYINHLTENSCSCINLDNHIQMEEIRLWLEKISADDRDNRAVSEWIRQNGKSFRDYLNTIKLIYTIWFCSRDHSRPLSWEEFCAIGDNLNILKDTCLDSIY